MLHLLPQYQKHKVVKEYRMRMALVFILALGTATLIFAIFTLPSYIYLSSEKKLLETKKTAIEATINTSKGNGENAIDISKALISLKPYETAISPNLYIDAISPNYPGITITGYAFNQANPADPVNVVLSGVGRTREELTAYADLLNERFGGVKLPLSSLANSSNISFDFRFTMTRDSVLKVINSDSTESPADNEIQN